MSTIECPVYLLRLAGYSLAHAVWCISDNEVLVPFVMQEKDEEANLLRMAAEQMDDAVEAGRRYLTDNPDEADRLVVLFDGYIRSDEEQHQDALILEASQFIQDPISFRVFLPYHPGKAGDSFAVYRPRVEFESETGLDPNDVSRALFEGVLAHEQGGEVWEKSLQDPGDS